MKESEHEPETLRDKWACDLGKLGKSWMNDLEGEIERQLNNLATDLFNPKKIMEFIKRSGVDFTGISGGLQNRSLADPYRTLGLQRSASDEEIKTRYRKLLWILHPDTAGAEGTEELFRAVTDAYEAIKKERGWQ
jgi:DnaJ-domain-containing protein 1